MSKNATRLTKSTRYDLLFAFVLNSPNICSEKAHRFCAAIYAAARPVFSSGSGRSGGSGAAVASACAPAAAAACFAAYSGDA